MSQVVTGINSATGQSEKNETASLFTPKRYKSDSYPNPELKDQQPAPGIGIPGFGVPKTLPFEDAYPLYLGSDDSAEQVEFVRHCAYRIDENYLEWMGMYMTGRASFGASTDILGQALSTASTLFSPNSTKTILSGLSAFVQGASNSVETRFFASLSAAQQIPQMNEARATKRAALESYLKSDDFNLSTAIGKLDELYLSGTLFYALAAEKKGG